MKNRRRAPMTDRRAYIALFSIAIGLAGLLIMFSARIVSGANNRTCQVLQVILLNPVPKPIGPHVLEFQRISYRRYLAFVDLNRELKCVKR